MEEALYQTKHALYTITQPYPYLHVLLTNLGSKVSFLPTDNAYNIKTIQEIQQHAKQTLKPLSYLNLTLITQP